MDTDERWFVYMLLCDEKTFYVGITPDLVNRIRQHKAKDSFFTKKFSQIRLIYCEQYKSEHEAAVREKQLKGWSRAKKQMLVDGKLGINVCTEFAVALLQGENLW
jgi:predicted GIY-YIG superfamily endonuclease